MVARQRAHFPNRVRVAGAAVCELVGNAPYKARARVLAAAPAAGDDRPVNVNERVTEAGVVVEKVGEKNVVRLRKNGRGQGAERSAAAAVRDLVDEAVFGVRSAGGRPRPVMIVPGEIEARSGLPEQAPEVVPVRDRGGAGGHGHGAVAEGEHVRLGRGRELRGKPRIVVALVVRVAVPLVQAEEKRVAIFETVGHALVPGRPVLRQGLAERGRPGAGGYFVLGENVVGLALEFVIARHRVHRNAGVRHCRNG